MRRPAPRPARRRRVVAAVAGTLLAAALGLAGGLGLPSLPGHASGSGHGVHTDIQSWS